MSFPLRLARAVGLTFFVVEHASLGRSFTAVDHTAIHGIVS